ncbi:hypothetical protein [Bradyrhizobium sp. P5_C12]
MSEDWDEQGSRAVAEAQRPGEFVRQHVTPLLSQRTRAPKEKTREKKGDPPSPGDRVFQSEEQFWEEAQLLTFHTVQLQEFRLSDWFPRTPGVYWSRHGTMARESTYRNSTTVDPKLGRIFSPQSKMSLIEKGGIGTIRLRPRRVDNTDSWFATAVKGPQCAGGIPLLIPHAFVESGEIEWGDVVNIVGKVRFLQDAKLDDVAAYVHHASPAIIFVEEIEQSFSKKRDREEQRKYSGKYLTITPVALFDWSSSSSREDSPRRHVDYGYTFVHSGTAVGHLDNAAEWIELYAEKHGGNVLTNFDERSPTLANAPLSYQRLVDKTYDRAIINNFHLERLADRIDSVSTQYVNYGNVEAMGDGARSVRNTIRKNFRGEDDAH